MRIAHLSDLHLCSHEIEKQAEVLDEIAESLDRHKIDLVAITGDLYGKTVPYESKAKERKAFFSFLYKAKQKGRYCSIVGGNHDLKDEFDGMAYVFAKPKTSGLVGIGSQAFVATFAYPDRTWLDVPPGFKEELTLSIKEAFLKQLWSCYPTVSTVPRVLLGHFGVREAKGVRDEIMGAHEPLFSLDDLPPFEFVLLGHYHEPQEMRSAKHPSMIATYAGSLFPFSYAEDYDHTWSIIDTDTRVIERIPIKAGWEVKTLRWRWHEGSWHERPSDADIAAITPKHRIKCQLVCSVADIEAIPFEKEVDRVNDRKPSWLFREVDLRPVFRVRSDAIAKATSQREKLEAYWATLSNPPSANERRSALDALSLLEHGF